jgi:phosphoglycolate phosphatase-like HAD superfamily hydrolase
MHVCLFDIDGTLIDTGGAGRDAMVAVLAGEFCVNVETDGVGFAGRTDRAIVSDLFRSNAIEDDEANWQRFCTMFVKHLPDYLARREGRVLPGVVELLELLRAREDVVLGLLTGNLRDGARLKLTHYGLYDYFFAADPPELGAFGDHRHARDEVACDAMAAVRRRYGSRVEVDRVWVVGDTPRDVQCARAIGAKAVAVATGGHSRDELRPTDPDLLLADLTETAPWLALLG